jgi:hypothetical protein
MSLPFSISLRRLLITRDSPLVMGIDISIILCGTFYKGSGEQLSIEEFYYHTMIPMAENQTLADFGD